MKKLITAKSAGFCYGVGRAVKMAENALKDGECFCLGDLIHNKDAVSRLRNLGLKTLSNISEIKQGDRVIIRSHGAGKNIYAELEKKGAVIIDATCPRVLEIHKIVADASEKGHLVLIIGDENHPEVQAICGWCEKSIVLANCNKLEEWLNNHPEYSNNALTAVFQTTLNKKNMDECVKFLKKEYTNCFTFDTICDITSIRQAEALEISSVSNAMIVIGGKHSANSTHLAEICESICKNTQFIESAEELDSELLKSADTIGITAGASTPAWIIKEVKHKMTDEIKIEDMNGTEEMEMTFDQMIEESLRPIYNGDTVIGIVAAITPTEISVDLSTKHSGYIPVSEFTDDPSVKITEIIKVGDSVEASVVRVNDVEGTVMLSKKRLDAVKHWNDIEAAREEGTVVEGTVTEENKGGVVVSVHGIRVFVPASQTGLGRDVPMTEIMKTKVRLKITEVNRSRRRVVGSIRAVASKERKEKADAIWNDIEVGKHYDGTVKNLTSYGAFVDIGGVDGMVHVTELSWNRIKHPSDVIAVGDSIDVFVLNFDKENRKISLGHKLAESNPWSKFMAACAVGDVKDVTIVKLMPFGAFAEVVEGVDGLIHISQIADRRIGKPSDVLNIGDVVQAKITNIDEENQKISLSIRALSEPEAPVDSDEDAAPVADEKDALVYEVSSTGEASGAEPTDFE